MEKIGGRRAIAWGLLLLGLGTVMRGLWTTVFSLYLFTVLLSLGIALTQTTVPVLIRGWFPSHIGLVTALFTDGLIIGETIGAGATVPLMMRFLGNDAWPATFIFWGIPPVVLLAIWLWLAPPTVGTRFIASSQIASSQSPVGTRFITSSVRRTLHFGFLLGAGSLIYFGMNSWIAVYNQAIHHAELTPLALTILNAAQLPASLGVTFFAQRLAGRRWPFVSAGFVCTVSIIGWVFAPVELEALWAALLGASSALVFTLGLALPPLLASPGKVARLTGATLSLSYSTAFVGPFIGGGLWDLFHLPALAFLPIGVASVLLVVLGIWLPDYSPS